jgi:pyruvate dehydrogenase E2 component (dihydrolipoamide acetyltransferase)
MAAKNVQLPELGEGVTEGELVKWLVKVGDKVQADQAVAEMMTDKATVEVPSPISGVVKELRSKEGEVVEVGHVMLVVETDGAAATAAPAPAAHAPTPAPAKPAPAAPVAAPVAAPAPAPVAAAALDIYPPVADAKVLATPATRRLAREMGVDLNAVKGTGVAGRVTRDDVTGSAGAGATAAGAPSFPAVARGASVPRGPLEERVPMRGIRKKVAENMQLSKRIIPHITLADEANVTALVKMREELKAGGTKITYLPFVIKALIAAVREFPMLNASIDDQAQEIVYKKFFNIGFAADTPNGLVVPVIKDADQKTLGQLSKEITDLATKARDGKLSLDEMRGATITVTNIGSIGSTYATPIINHPEVAILGMYKIQEKPVVKRTADGKIEIDVIQNMNFTITCDHRLIDGAVAARFLAAFIKRIENPGFLMLEMA